MLKRSQVIAATIITLAAPAGWASDCNPAEAEIKFSIASDAGVILSAGSFNGIPTITVDPPTWDLMNVDERLGMIETIECAIAGPGNILAELQIIEPSGKPMAIFDGITRNLEVTR